MEFYFEFFNSAQCGAFENKSHVASMMRMTQSYDTNLMTEYDF